MSDPKVVDNADRSRYEISVDDSLAGIAEYRREGGHLVLTHTEVSDEFEGQGLGSTLIGQVLDTARRNEERVVPLCQFVVAYLHRHPEDVELVDDEHRAQFDGDRG
jgi:hypothetical protein